MERINPQAIKRLLKEDSKDVSRLSMSYGAQVSEQITKMFAGNPAAPEGDEFRLMVASWTEALQDVVPEYRLNDAFIYARQHRNSTFPMDVSEVCAAWKAIKDAERSIPPTGSYEWGRARKVCPDCNNTGTKLIVKRDEQLGRDYTYGVPCAVL
jgi:hypothetical protein